MNALRTSGSFTGNLLGIHGTIELGAWEMAVAGTGLEPVCVPLPAGAIRLQRR